MAKPYDAATKDLIRWRPADFLTLAGLPVPADAAGVVMLDAELSTMTRAADKLIRVEGTPGGPYLVVVEFQSGYDDRMDDRVALYNAMARWLYDLPVRNVVYLLSRAARSRGTTGRVDGPGLTFVYDVISVWTLPVADLLDGPIGTVPFAPLADQPADQLPATIDRVWQRLKTGVAQDRLADVVTQTAVLIGLRHDKLLAERLMQSVLDMEESTVYQAILQKGLRQGIDQGFERGMERGMERGLERGIAEEQARVLARLATSRLGVPSDADRQRFLAALTAGRADQVESRLLSAASWDELLAD